MSDKQQGMLDALEAIENYFNIRLAELAINPIHANPDEEQLIAYLFTQTAYLRMRVRSLGSEGEGNAD